MPRLKPPPSERPTIEDNTLPTEPIEIELVPDEPVETEVELTPPVRVERRTTPPAEEDSPLQKALEATRTAEETQARLQRERDEALRTASQRDVELTRERGDREDAQYNSVLTAISAEQSTLDKAEADYAGYASVGDWANAGRAQRIMSSASARLDRLEDGKLAFEQKREAAKTAPPEQQRTQPQQPELPDNAKAWLRKHPEFTTDNALNEKIGNAHNYLVKNRGIEAFSTAYFDALDTEFGFKGKDDEPEPQPQRRSMPLSAPVSRDVPTADGQRQKPGTIKLSPEEVQIARTAFTASDMTNAQKELLYAQNKRKLQNMRANGQYPQSERN